MEVSPLTAIIFYFTGLVMTFFVSLRMADDLREKHPSLLDKRWKRVLWLFSCLLFLPIPIIFHYIVVTAIKEFISGKEK